MTEKNPELELVHKAGDEIDEEELEAIAGGFVYPIIGATYGSPAMYNQDLQRELSEVMKYSRINSSNNK